MPGSTVDARTAIFAFLLWSTAVSYAEPTDVLPVGARTFIAKNCIICHHSSNAPAGLDLTSLEFALNDPQTFSRWVRLHDLVRDGVMPPGGEKTLKPQEREAFLKSIRAPMVASEQRRAMSQGRSVLRRLNRYEYENSLRDLLSAPWLQVRDSLPEDALAGRLNKIGQALDISHVQMVRYMEAADQAIRAVLQASKQQRQQKRYYAREQKSMLARMSPGQFQGIPERATIPVLGFEAQPDVLKRKAPITVGESDPKTRELEAIVTPASTYVGYNYSFDQFAAPSGGMYRLRLSTYSIWIHTMYYARPERGGYWHPNREKTSRGRTTEPVTLYALNPGGEKRLLGTFDARPEPSVNELEVYLLAGEKIVPDASRLFRSRPFFLGSPDATEEGMPGVAYRWMEVDGPFQGAGSQGLARFFGGLAGIGKIPSSSAEIELLLRQFMATAYRRPPTEVEVQRYLKLINDSLVAARKHPNRGPADVTEALITGYTAVLCSPGFVYLEEEPGPLKPHALASRLSYFLWNAPPDQELRALSADGRIRGPETLRAQTNRLLDDPRSEAFVNAFLDYWLDLRKLGETTPDQTLYPDYYLDDLLTESAVRETQLFFRHLLRQNLPVKNIIDCDFAMLNSHLARHYGLPPVDGIAMRQVQLADGSVRGGLLTQASVLKITANGTTTSPVLRGAWIMERILGDPPPPPPAGVPAVEPDTRGATTIREQLDKHRSVRSCAVCHSKIDPTGFALENFDVFGGWRDRYRSTDEGEPVKGLGKNGFPITFRQSQPVDASGQLASGERFQDVKELKRLLAKDERKLARNMVNQFVAYATGAPAGFGDRDEIERILDAAERDRFGMRTLIQQITQSRLFRYK